MPFLPLVVVLAWQALSRSASFALGWATGLYFGQVPGHEGRMLAVISLVAAGWVIVLLGFGVPLVTGAILEATGVVGENFDVQFIHYLGLAAVILVAPLVVAGAVVWGGFHSERTIGAWLKLVPVSYPASFMLGISVLQMVVFTPFLLFQRWRQKRKLVQVPLVMRKGTDDDDMVQAVHKALSAIGIEKIEVAEATGPKAWPMRTLGFAARHLLGAVVRGEPMHLQAGDLSVYAYATNVSILGAQEDAYRARAAVERELAFSDAYLTWNQEAQGFEDELREAHEAANGDVEALRRQLDEVQSRIDVASLNSEEWNVLYRLRLQVEQAAVREPGTRPSG